MQIVVLAIVLFFLLVVVGDYMTQQSRASIAIESPENFLIPDEPIPA